MKNREWLRRLPMDLLMDIVGGLIYAVGLNCFANPNDIAPGGIKLWLRMASSTKIPGISPLNKISDASGISLTER